MIALCADSKLLCHVNVSLLVQLADLVDLVDHVLVTLPDASTVWAGDLGFSSSTLSLGGSPHLEALPVDVLSTCSRAPHNILLAGSRLHLLEADGAIALNGLAVLVVRMSVAASRLVRGKGRIGEDVSQLGAQEGQLVDVLLLRTKDL